MILEPLMKSELSTVNQYIDEQNKEHYNNVGLHIRHLTETALLHVWQTLVCF